MAKEKEAKEQAETPEREEEEEVNLRTPLLSEPEKKASSGKSGTNLVYH
jgi:hypothetical protein